MRVAGSVAAPLESRPLTRRLRDRAATSPSSRPVCAVHRWPTRRVGREDLQRRQATDPQTSGSADAGRAATQAVLPSRPCAGGPRASSRQRRAPTPPSLARSASTQVRHRIGLPASQLKAGAPAEIEQLFARKPARYRKLLGITKRPQAQPAPPRFQQPVHRAHEVAKIGGNQIDEPRSQYGVEAPGASGGSRPSASRKWNRAASTAPCGADNFHCVTTCPSSSISALASLRETVPPRSTA